MLAILYLCVCAITGMVLVAICVPDVRRLYLACAPSVKAIENIPSTLFVVAAGTVSGMMLVPFVNYYVILGLTYFVASDKLCMKIGFMVTAALFFWLVLTCLIIVNRRRIKKDEQEEDAGFVKLPTYVNKPSNTLFYSFVILLTAVISAFLMFYTYRIDHGSLINGYSTFSDLSPHTAMVSSFGKGFNFPTQYMHFSGDGIKYHFLFYFLCGMLEYLGFPIDYALNIPSILAMVCAMILLGLLAVLLSGRRLAFAISPVLVFLRSSFNVFIHIKNLMAEGNSITGAIGLIMQESSWYEVTPYDSWGIWAINVYPNQRHLMLGVAVIILCIILFIPFVRRLCISVMSAGSFGGVFKAFLFSRNAWLPRKNDPLSGGTVALYTCLLVIVMPYFHGSCLISLLLVLFGMALVSESRLLHLMTAVCAVCSSYIQTTALSGGASNVINLKFAPGFLFNEDTTVITADALIKWGGYLLTVTGATLVIAILCNVILLFHDIIKKKPVYRFFLSLAFLNPLIFAFLFQVSLEMLANHKFIQISLILVDAFVAIFLANLFVVPGRRKAVALAADEDIADVEDTGNDSSEAKETADDAEKLEAKTEKTENEDDEPFEVLTDSEDDDIGLPEEIAKDEETEKSDEKKDEDDKDEKPSESDKTSANSDADDSDDADVASDDRILEKFPSETSVSMRPGNIVNSETEKDSEKEETPAKEEASDKEDAKTSEDTEESFPKEDTVSLRPGNLVDAHKEDDTPAKEESSSAEETEVKEDKPDTSDEKNSEEKTEAESSEKVEETRKEESSEDTDELPFEVLDDDEESDKSEKEDKSEDKSLAEVKDDKEAKEASEDKSDKDDEDEADTSDMILEHQEIASDKSKGMPVAVWAVFEIFGVLAALILLVALVGTGISEWATYININSTPMAVNTNSPVSEWIMKNTEPDDVFLTPAWSMNRFLLTGRPMYYGWPYYAWSAGHDTNTRDKIYVWLITGCGGDINEFKRYCKERGIRYLIADPEFEDGDYGEGVYFNREFFEQNLQQVAYFTEENTVIYKIY